MKVYELMNLLKNYPAGGEIEIGVYLGGKEIPKMKETDTLRVIATPFDVDMGEYEGIVSIDAHVKHVSEI